MIIYEIGSNGYWTGVSQDITSKAAPLGWTRSVVPYLEPGEYAYWIGEWSVVTTEPTPTYINDTPPSQGIQGIQGIQGVSGSSNGNTVRVDFFDDNTTYKGEAIAGSIESDAVWRIIKIVTDTTGNISKILANGNSEYINIWNDRLSLSYS
jgi:hypothetical protein